MFMRYALHRPPAAVLEVSSYALIYTIFLGTAALLLLMLLGMPVAFAFLGVTAAAMYHFMGGPHGLTQLVLSVFDSLNKFSLTAIPFYTLMGEVLYHAGIVRRSLDVFARLVGAIPGRLAIITFFTGGLFAAVRGARRLLINAIVPGYILLGIFVGFVMIRCIRRPELAPAYEAEPGEARVSLLRDPGQLFPLLLVIIVALGLMSLGVATPTEAAALASLCALLLAAWYRQLTWDVLRTALVNAVQVTVMILTITAASAAFSQVLAFSGASAGLLRSVLAMGACPLGVVALMIGIVIVLRAFMEQASIMMITLPIFMPIVRAYEIDGVWFCILMLPAGAVGQLCPPFGLALFVMKSASPPEITMSDIYRAAVPYAVLIVVLPCAGDGGAGVGDVVWGGE